MHLWRVLFTSSPQPQYSGYWSIPSFVHQQTIFQTDWCLDTMAAVKPKFFDFYKLCFISHSIARLRSQSKKWGLFSRNCLSWLWSSFFQPSLSWSRTQSLTVFAKISSSATSAWFVSLSGRGARLGRGWLCPNGPGRFEPRKKTPRRSYSDGQHLFS